jgi:hypothetical protein
MKSPTLITLLTAALALPASLVLADSCTQGGVYCGSSLLRKGAFGPSSRGSTCIRYSTLPYPTLPIHLPSLSPLSSPYCIRALANKVPKATTATTYSKIFRRQSSPPTRLTSRTPSSTAWTRVICNLSSFALKGAVVPIRRIQTTAFRRLGFGQGRWNVV